MKKIEFVNNTGLAQPEPVAKSRELAFRDLVFKEEYKGRKCRFGQGLTWLRFLPAVKPSVYDWMMPVEIHRDINGVTFVSPRSLDSNVQTPFDIARMWLYKHNKGALSSRDKNPNGLRLYSQRYGIAWAIEEAAPEGQRLKLFYASLYDGVRGGTTGLGYNVRREADARDNEPGSPTVGQLIHGDVTDPTSGRLVKVERAPTEKNEYASYKAGIGKNPAPVEHFLNLLTDEEMELITPLENTIYIPSEQEMLDILKRYIGDEFYNQIFTEMSPEEELVGPSRNRSPKATAATPVVEAKVVTKEVDEEDEDEDLEEVAPKRSTKTQSKNGSKSDSSEETPYTTREVTALLGEEKEGVATLLRNKHRLSKAHLEIVLDSAKEYGLVD
jgi:hypothetical protein